MSLVGPRPLLEDNEYFDKNYMRRLNVIPGMTGSSCKLMREILMISETWYKYDIESH